MGIVERLRSFFRRRIPKTNRSWWSGHYQDGRLHTMSYCPLCEQSHEDMGIGLPDYCPICGNRCPFGTNCLGRQATWREWPRTDLWWDKAEGKWKLPTKELE